jgi:hypothetical protein
MALTAAQQDLLATEIAADPVLGLLPHNSDSADAVSIAYSLVAVPDFWVWRTSVSIKEIYETTTADATSWSTPALIARSQAERDAWRDVFVASQFINAALPNTRQGMADIFSGAQGTPQRTHLITLARRRANRAEQLFATGQGSTANPATMTFEGTLHISDVLAAWEV